MLINDFDSVGDCGWTQYEDAGIEGGSLPGEQIINGWRARPDEFPWQVREYIK